MNRESHETNSSVFAPLVRALDLICFQLSHSAVSGAALDIIVASPTLDELKQQTLPPHIETAVRKRKGPRISKRGARNLRMTRLVKAHWPEDRQLENTVPALAYVLSGQADFHLEDYVLYLQQGDFLHIPAGIAKPDAHAPYVLDGTDRRCDLLWIYPGPLKGDGVECWICRTENGKKHTGAEYGSSSVQNRFIANLFEEFSLELKRESQPQLRRQLLFCLLLWLRREIAEGHAELPQVRRLHRSVERQPDFIEEACQFVSSNLNSPLTISRVAGAVGVSPATFTRHFRRKMGMSFNEYLTQKRLKAAESYLANTTSPINAVASSVGLRKERLRIIFYQKHRCSPSEFRKQRISQEN